MSGRRKIGDAIKAAKPAKPSADALPGANVPSYLLARFEMLPLGLTLKRTADKPARWICSNFEIAAETFDPEAQVWGLLLTWRDRNGLPRSEVFSRDLFSGDCAELRARLARGGLTMHAASWARQALAEYLGLACTDQRAHCVAKTGWHVIAGAQVFVLTGDEVFGVVAERVVLQTSAREPSPYGIAGTVGGWRDTVGRLCVGNSRLCFSVSAGFAAPLLQILGEDGGGFHLRGKSRTGKSTLLRAAASVWGGATGQGAASYVKTWRATSSGLEGTAAAHNDALLLLDELGQVDAKEAGEIAYMLASGRGRTRADRTGGLRAQTAWRVLFLSSGEIGLADKNPEAGLAPRAGQEVRLIDLPADAGGDHGVFDTLHDAESADAFIEELRAATRQHYGTPARAFLQDLVAKLQRDPELPARLRARMHAQAAALLRHYPEAGAQVQSVAHRFALVAIAGELATEACITGWAADEAAQSAQALFDAWLIERGSSGAHEDAQAVVQLRAFISRHGTGRFEKWGDPSPAEQKKSDTDSADQSVQSAPDPGKIEPQERFLQRDRAGWRRWQVEEQLVRGKLSPRGFWRYFLTEEAMHEALRGLDFRSACRTLVDRQLLLADSQGKSTKAVRPPGVAKKIRLYECAGTVIGAATADTADADDD